MGGRVFVHEPDPDVAVLYRVSLSRRGWTVVERPGDALVLVLDADPIGRELAAAYRELPIVVVSVFFRDEVPDLAELAARFLVKPFSLTLLAAAVAEATCTNSVAVARDRAD
jgi:DNA-binding response OmpR family regulator